MKATRRLSGPLCPSERRLNETDARIDAPKSFVGTFPLRRQCRRMEGTVPESNGSRKPPRAESKQRRAAGKLGVPRCLNVKINLAARRDGGAERRCSHVRFILGGAPGAAERENNCAPGGRPARRRSSAGAPRWADAENTLSTPPHVRLCWPRRQRRHGNGTGTAPRRRYGSGPATAAQIRTDRATAAEMRNGKGVRPRGAPRQTGSQRPAVRPESV